MASAEQVKELRGRTGAGIMECKQALLESDDDIDKAIDHLRKQGSVKAAKKSGRLTHEGRVEIAVGPGGDRAAIIEVNCETDFVARNDDFKTCVSELAQHGLEMKDSEMDSFLDSELSGQTVANRVQELIAKVGENLSVARFDVCSCDKANEIIGSYTHAGNQIGVIVKVAGNKVAQEMVRDIAMHVAAMHPLYVGPDEILAELAEKEKDLLRSSPDMAGKPPEVMEKMVAGRYRKFLSQVCLVEQAFIKDPEGKQTVGQFLTHLDPEARIVCFFRYQVGESSAS